MKACSRRHFLQGLGQASLAALLGGGLPLLGPLRAAGAVQIRQGTRQGREILALTHSDIKPANPRDYLKRVGAIHAFDPASNEMWSIETPVTGHTVNQCPSRPSMVITTEKWGNTGVVADLDDRKMLMTFEASKGNGFFGHSVFAQNGSVLISSELNQDNGKGFLAIRDTRNFRFVHRMRSYGARPHECQTFDGGKTIMVANAWGPKGSNLSWIDVQTEELKHQIMLNGYDDVFFSHFAVAHDGWIVVVGNADPLSGRKQFDMISFVSPDGIPHKPEFPAEIAKRLTFEALSVAFIGKSGLVAITDPIDNILLVMDYKKNEFLTAVELPGPAGVIATKADLSDDAVLVTQMGAPGAVRMSYKRKRGMTLGDSGLKLGGTGPHLNRLYI